MVRPSNGAEGEAWMAAWCATCVADAGAPEDGCAIVMEGLLGGHPPEWHRGPFWSPQTVMFCDKYVPRAVQPEPVDLGPATQLGSVRVHLPGEV